MKLKDTTVEILERGPGEFELWAPEGEDTYEQPLGYFLKYNNKHFFSPSAYFSFWELDAKELRRIARKLDALDRALDATKGE